MNQGAGNRAAAVCEWQEADSYTRAYCSTTKPPLPAESGMRVTVYMTS